MNLIRNSAMVLLDLQKAFDSMWHDGLLHKLHVMYFLEYLIKIIRCYLTSKAFYELWRATMQHPINIRILQDSILGSILFNIFINDIPRSTKTHLAIYADDTDIYLLLKSKFAHFALTC